MYIVIINHIPLIHQSFSKTPKRTNLKFGFVYFNVLQTCNKSEVGGEVTETNNFILKEIQFVMEIRKI